MQGYSFLHLTPIASPEGYHGWIYQKLLRSGRARLDPELPCSSHQRSSTSHFNSLPRLEPWFKGVHCYHIHSTMLCKRKWKENWLLKNIVGNRGETIFQGHLKQMFCSRFSTMYYTVFRDGRHLLILEQLGAANTLLPSHLYQLTATKSPQDNSTGPVHWGQPEGELGGRLSRWAEHRVAVAAAEDFPFSQTPLLPSPTPPTVAIVHLNSEQPGGWHCGSRGSVKMGSSQLLFCTLHTHLLSRPSDSPSSLL